MGQERRPWMSTPFPRPRQGERQGRRLCLVWYRFAGNAHSLFFSLKPATAVPCGPAVTSLRPTMTSTTLIATSFSCLRTLALRPTLLEGLTEVDVLHIVLGCRFVLDIFTISQRHSPPHFSFLSKCVHLTVTTTFCTHCHFAKQARALRVLEVFVHVFCQHTSQLASATFFGACVCLPLISDGRAAVCAAAYWHH